MSQTEKQYDLEKRTFRFSKRVVQSMSSLTRNVISDPIIKQIVRSSTGVAANYCEANEASSKRDFKNKINICKKEAHETKYWLKLIRETLTENIEIEKLQQEALELTLIFSAIIKSCNRQMKI